MPSPRPDPTSPHVRAPLRWRLLVALLLLGVVVAGGFVVYQGRETERAERITRAMTQPPHFVGAAACASCHTGQATAWEASHHAKAMAVASESTVLGAFDGGRYEQAGVASTFFRRDGRWFVNTDGPDGENRDYEIRYTFGVYPLQQYLVAFPDGRLQALGIAWDARPAEAGGQRWFHLYPTDTPRAGDALHWTGHNQTWNYMCASCHSTGLHVNYDRAADRYATAWQDINVSCEACHGPASRHVAWAEGWLGTLAGSDKGLVRLLASPAADHWTFTDAQRIAAERMGPARGDTEVQTCSACHARRRPLDTAPAGEPGRFLDHYMPALLDAGLYHADGQILDEVYEWGSFVQSRMYRAGVTCTNCHDAHSLKPRAPGNALCLQCHAPAKFEVVEHHHHKPGTEGAQCVSCHMPQKLYMGVDLRRDHGLRVPRPDLSDALGTPNACTQCHSERPASWAADAIAAWFGPERRHEPRFGEALHAARSGQADARRLLLDFLGKPDTPAIARASLLGELPMATDRRVIDAVRRALADPDALVRAAALARVGEWPPQERARFAAVGLTDPVRAVRLAAALALADAPAESLSPADAQALKRSLAELESAELATAERPESHLNLATLYLRRGQADVAESELKTALRLDPKFVPAYVNLADLYRSTGRETEVEAMLLKALELAPDAHEPRHALGLLRVRQHRQDEALTLLGAAARWPDQPRYAYVYAVALNSWGHPQEAIAFLRTALARRPGEAQWLSALAAMLYETGERDEARRVAGQWLAQAPGDVDAQRLVQSLR